MYVYTEFKYLPLVLQEDMDRGTCWSITINNPTDEDLYTELPAKWKMKGQIEAGKETGTRHYQGMLITPQVRAAAVKKTFPRAHIELAKNKAALEKYVHKSETRLEAVPDRVSNIPTLFDYQHTIAERWDDTEFTQLWDKRYTTDTKLTESDVALEYVDIMVSHDIEDGVCGVEYIAINPMWRSAWKKFWKSMVARERAKIKNCTEDIECESTLSESESSESAKSFVETVSPPSTEPTCTAGKGS